MAHPRFFKGWSAPVRILTRPMWFISLGLHALLLSIPIPSQQQAEPPSEKKSVKVTQLPPPPSPQPSPTVQRATPSPVVQPSTPLPVRPSLRVQPNTSLIIQPSPRLQQPQPSPRVAQNTPSPTPTPTPTPSPTPTPTPTPSPTPTPTPTPSPTPTPTPTPSPTPDDPLAEFPQIEGAQAGCNGLLGCWQTPETQWRDVSSNLEQELEAKGYQVKALDLEDDTGRRVYEVSKAGEIKYYLNVLSTNRGTVYKISQEPLTREQLNQAAAL